MRFVIQRVKNSKVTVNNEVIGKIGKGFMVLIGISNEDTTETADKMLRKLLNMHNDSYAANRTPGSIPMNFFSIPLNGKCLNSPPTIELG